MQYDNAQYVYSLDNSKIECVRCEVEGRLTFVPADESNLAYKEMMKLVEEGQLEIAPAVKWPEIK